MTTTFGSLTQTRKDGLVEGLSDKRPDRKTVSKAKDNSLNPKEEEGSVRRSKTESRQNEETGR